MMKLTGYAAVFNEWALIAGSFRERVLPGAFSTTLRSDREIHLIHHHDYRTVLATTRNGTLKLNEDSKGLYFSAELPDTTAAVDLVKLIRLRYIRGMSFAFNVRGADGQEWRDGKNGVPERDLLDLKLIEITVTPIPAYTQASVAIRSSKPAPAKARMLEKLASTKSPTRSNARLKRKALMLKQLHARS